MRRGVMIAEKIEEYVSAGKIVRGEKDLAHAEGLLREAVFDLSEARKTQEVGAHRATFFLSYMAMLRAGRALLIFNGFRPAKCSQHRTIVDATCAVIGDGCPSIASHFEDNFKKQVDLIHDGGNLLTELESHDAFHYALLMTREITKRFKKEDPNFHVTL